MQLSTSQPANFTDSSSCASQNTTTTKIGGDTSSRERVTQRFFRRRPQDSLPLTLTHDRVYILPTRRGWAFLLSLLLMLVASMNYALGLGYALCFLLCGLFSSALLATYRNLAGISLTRIAPQSACVGEQIVFTLTLQNPGKQVARMIRIRNHAENETLIAEIPGNAEVTTDIKQTALSRGWQKCGRLTFTSDYPLGLWYSWGYMHVPAEALVYASPETNPPVFESKSTDTDNDASPSTRGDSSGIPDAMREYVAGDSPSLINWKASARGNGMYTREFADNASSDTIALKWTETALLEDNDLRVARLSAWIVACAEKGIDWTLQLPDGFFEEATADQTSLLALEQKAQRCHQIDAGLPDTLISHGADQRHLLNCLQALALTELPDNADDVA